MKEEMRCVLDESDDIFIPFSREERLANLKYLKTGKASGLDGTSAKMLKYFEGKTLDWLLRLHFI